MRYPWPAQFKPSCFFQEHFAQEQGSYLSKEDDGGSALSSTFPDVHFLLLERGVGVGKVSSFKLAPTIVIIKPKTFEMAKRLQYYIGRGGLH